MPRTPSLPAVALILCILAVSCGDDTTAPPPGPVSVRSYLAEVFGAEYVAGAALPTPTVPTALVVVTADSSLGRGSTFGITLNHPVGIKQLTLGVESAVGYFELRVDSMSTETRIRGRLSGANRDNFQFVCGGRGTDGSVFTPATHDMEVLSGESVLYYITGVIGADGTRADYIDAELPLATTRPTITEVTGDSIVVNGGSMAVTLTCTVPASGILVGVPDTRGHFRLPTTGLPGDASMTILIAQSAPSSFIIQFLSEEPGPEYGAIVSIKPTLIHVGSGDLQVSLAFRPSQDLDLHLVEPTGDEIYYGNLTSPAGGRLDLDSNPACNQDHKNNENITYDTGEPPEGEYVVRVDFWESCDGTGADFRVVVAVLGDVQMYNGHFEANEADGGGLGSGREICRFTY